MMKASRIISLVMVIFSICIFIYETIDLCRPWIIGSDIDMDILKDLDTNAISENYSQMDYYEYEDSRIFIDKYYEYAIMGKIECYRHFVSYCQRSVLWDFLPKFSAPVPSGN